MDIREQYMKYGVRCFDLRVRVDDEGVITVAHGPIEYDISTESLWEELKWIDEKGDCYVRVLHEVRTSEQYTPAAVKNFEWACAAFEDYCPYIQFWCGRNLYNWQKDYEIFGEPTDDPTCEETYGSVIPGKKWLYGWWPWLYARTHNKAIRQRGTDKDILLIDYVDI